MKIFNVILWCIVFIMWIITLIADLIYSIPVWLIITHAVFCLICLIVAIVYIVKFSKSRKDK